MSWFITHLQQMGARTAVIDKHDTFSYAQLLDQVQTYKAALDTHFSDGQVVAILSDYNFYAIALFIALLKKKAIIIPLTSTNQAEIDKRLNIADCNWEVRIANQSLELSQRATTGRHAMIEGLIRQQQTGLILFSSGSTGEPKAMIHNLDNLINSYQGKKIKKITILIFLMFDHIGGLNTLLNSLAMGAKIVLPSSRNPYDIAQLIEEHQVHVLPASPTFFNMMLMAKVQERYSLSTLKMITYGTEPMPESLLKKLRQTFPRTKIMQTFGTSETGIAQTSSRSSDSLELRLNDSNVEYKIVHGELWIRSKTQVIGYLNASMDSFTQDGWFKTGDLVEERAEGYLYIKGRAKEVINVGGEKVLPAEIESVVLDIDAVEDCLVYGAKNAITGQMVAIQLVIAPDVDKQTMKKRVRQHCRAKLDAYKVPVKIEFVEQINFGTRFKKKRIGIV